MPAYLKSAIPPGRKPLCPLKAGGQNPKSEHSAFFYMLGHGQTQTVKPFIKLGPCASVWVCGYFDCPQIPHSNFPIPHSISLFPKP